MNQLIITVIGQNRFKIEAFIGDWLLFGGSSEVHLRETFGLNSESYSLFLLDIWWGVLGLGFMLVLQLVRLTQTLTISLPK